MDTWHFTNITVSKEALCQAGVDVIEHALQVTDPALGLAEVVSQTALQRTFTVCLGDHGCECSFFTWQSGAISKHVVAAAVLCPFTLDMREATARHLISCGRL